MCCQFTFHHEFGIYIWRSKFKQKQEVFFLSVDPMGKNHRNPGKIDHSFSRHAQFLHTVWKKPSRRSIFERHQSCAEDEIEVLSNFVECNHPSKEISSLLQSEKCWDRMLSNQQNDKAHMSPRPSPKISLKNEWKRELESEHAQQSEIKRAFGHDRFWPTAFPTLATTQFGHDLLRPRPTLDTTSPTLATVNLGHFRGKISRFFFLPPTFSCPFFSLWRSSRGILVDRDLKCACFRPWVVVWEPLEACRACKSK